MLSAGLTGHEPARVALKVPTLPRTTGNAVKDAQAVENWRFSILQFLIGYDPKLLIFLRDDNVPLTRAELKVAITPPPLPPPPLSSASSSTSTTTTTTATATVDHYAAMRVAVAALSANPTWEEMENAIPAAMRIQLTTRVQAILAEAMSNNAHAMLIIRRAGREPHLKWQAVHQRFAQLGAISAANLIHQHEHDRIKPNDNPEKWLDLYVYRYDMLLERKQDFSDQYKCINLIEKLEAASHLPFKDFGKTCYFSKEETKKPDFATLVGMAREQMQALSLLFEQKKAPKAEPVYYTNSGSNGYGHGKNAFK